MTDPLTILQGDAVEMLKTLPDESVQTCVTSPPYWGLRSYLPKDHPLKPFEIGQEKTPADYVAKMVEVFAEVRRVLKSDGTCWLNLGDSYNAYNGGAGPSSKLSKTQSAVRPQLERGYGLLCKSLKPKDLVGIPWRVAFALQADGWYLRSDIIWAKKNCMPESVTDRPTRSHEYIFLLAKGQTRYRTILFSDVEPEFFHFGCNIGLDTSGFRFSTTALCVRLATALFDSAQRQNNFSLPPFYSKEWEKCLGDSNSNLVSSLPPIHRMAAYASRFLNTKTSSKEFLHEIQCAFANLGKSDHFLICRGVSESLNSPSVFVDGNASITINDSGKICEFDFIHARIIEKVPTTCKYFYDHEAIKEPCIYDVDGTGTAARKARANGNKLLPTEQVNGIRPGGYKNSVNFDGKNKGMDKQRGHGRRHDGFNDRWDQMEEDEKCTGMRNKRDVWWVSPAMYPEAHFATFSPELILPCILAGSRTGDVVLDPFLGSGTTAKVALEEGRKAIGIELNSDYIPFIQQRTNVTVGLPL